MASRAGGGRDRVHPYVNGRMGESSSTPPTPTGLPIPVNGAVNKRDAGQGQVGSSPPSTFQIPGPSRARSGPSSGPQSRSSSTSDKSVQTDTWDPCIQFLEDTYELEIQFQKVKHDNLRLRLHNADLKKKLRELRELQRQEIVEDEDMEPKQQQ